MRSEMYALLAICFYVSTRVLQWLWLNNEQYVTVFLEFAKDILAAAFDAENDAEVVESNNIEPWIFEIDW